MKKGDVYDCISIGGNLVDVKEGEWIIDCYTPKTIVMLKTNGGYMDYGVGDKIRHVFGKNQKYSYKLYDDGDLRFCNRDSGKVYLFTKKAQPSDCAPIPT